VRIVRAATPVSRNLRLERTFIYIYVVLCCADYGHYIAYASKAIDHTHMYMMTLLYDYNSNYIYIILFFMTRKFDKNERRRNGFISRRAENLSHRIAETNRWRRYHAIRLCVLIICRMARTHLRRYQSISCLSVIATERRFRSSDKTITKRAIPEERNFLNSIKINKYEFFVMPGSFSYIYTLAEPALRIERINHHRKIRIFIRIAQNCPE